MRNNVDNGMLESYNDFMKIKINENSQIVKSTFTIACCHLKPGQPWYADAAESCFIIRLFLKKDK